jgi:hypothetical protein
MDDQPQIRRPFHREGRVPKLDQAKRLVPEALHALAAAGDIQQWPPAPEFRARLLELADQRFEARIAMGAAMAQPELGEHPRRILLPVGHHPAIGRIGEHEPEGVAPLRRQQGIQRGEEGDADDRDAERAAHLLHRAHARAAGAAEPPAYAQAFTAAAIYGAGATAITLALLFVLLRGGARQ